MTKRSKCFDRLTKSVRLSQKREEERRRAKKRETSRSGATMTTASVVGGGRRWRAFLTAFFFFFFFFLSSILGRGTTRVRALYPDVDIVSRKEALLLREEVRWDRQVA